MQYTSADLRTIYNRTSGKCHICGKKLALSNYSLFGERGAWEVEHSNARARGGTDRLNNLYAACISCNRSKGALTTRAARPREGRTRAPLSREKRKAARRENAFLGGALSVLGGVALGATGVGLMVLGGLGAAAGYNVSPDK
jgi:5-methylcytosine-specific restriction endonuclease McrA